MKLLLDENLSRRLVPFLQADYPESSQVVLLNLENTKDEIIWDFAREHGFVIVTKDADFYELSLHHQARAQQKTVPKVIWIRTTNSPKDKVLDLLIKNKKFIEEQFNVYAKLCVQLY